LPRRRSPSRGKSRRGSRSVRRAEGTPTFRENMPPDDQGVLGPSRRRGTSRHPFAASLRKGRGTFAPGESTRVRAQPLPHPSSAQPTVDSRRRLARGVTRSGGLRCSTCRQTCTFREAASMARTWLAARLPSEEGGLSHAERVERRAREAGANAAARLIQTGSPRPQRARIGRSRSCSRVVDVVAEVDRQWPAQRSGRTSISPDLEAFRDGRLARSSNVRKYAAAGEETLAPSSKRKPHVTVLESGCDPRMARQAGDGRHLGS